MDPDYNSPLIYGDIVILVYTHTKRILAAHHKTDPTVYFTMIANPISRVLFCRQCRWQQEKDLLFATQH